MKLKYLGQQERWAVIKTEFDGSFLAMAQELWCHVVLVYDRNKASGFAFLGSSAAYSYIRPCKEANDKSRSNIKSQVWSDYLGLAYNETLHQYLEMKPGQNQWWPQQKRSKPKDTINLYAKIDLSRVNFEGNQENEKRNHSKRWATFEKEWNEAGWVTWFVADDHDSFQ